MPPAFFPTLHTEELLYSALARYGQLAGHRTMESLHEDVFGHRRRGAAVDLPAGLSQLLARLPAGHPYDSDRLVSEHTQWPYLLRFADSADRAATRRAMESDLQRVVHRHGVLSRWFAYPEALQACPACVIADERDLGHAYWRRSHQLPGVLLCPDHGVPLVETPVHRARGPRVMPYVPLASGLVADGRPRRVDAAALDALRRIAQGAQWLLTHDALAFPDVQPKLLELLTVAGWRRWHKQLRTVDLAAALAAHSLARTLLPTVPDTEASLRTALNRLMYGRNPKHPLLIQIILEFLGLPISEAFAPLTGEGDAPRKLKKTETPLSKFDDQALPCWNPVCAAYAGPPRPILQSLTLPLKRYEIVCAICGYTYRWDPRRPRSRTIVQTGDLWDEAVRRLIADDRKSLRNVANQLEVDLSTLYRQARRLGCMRNGCSEHHRLRPRRDERFARLIERHRVVWLKERTEHPERRSCEFSKSVRQAYRFLSQHDAEWLRENRPLVSTNRVSGRRRVDWEARDREWSATAHAILSAVDSAHAPGRSIVPIVGSALGTYHSMLKNRNRLPRLWALIEEFSLQQARPMPGGGAISLQSAEAELNDFIPR